MKTTFKLTSVALLTLALVGCESQIEPLGGKILPDPNIEKAELALSGKAAMVQEVKADNQEALTNGTQVGIFVVDKTSGESLNSASVVTNGLYTANGAGGLTGGASPVELLMGYHYEVYGYAPYSGTLSGTTLSVGHDTDFIWALAADEVPNTTVHTTDLVFDHKTAQIQFKVAGSEGVDISGGYTFTVTGFYGSGVADLATGIVTPGAVDDGIVVSTVEDPVCFIVPTSGKLPLAVTVTVGSVVYTGTLSVEFEAGKSYIYTLTASDEETFDLGFTAEEVSWVEETGSVTGS